MTDELTKPRTSGLDDEAVRSARFDALISELVDSRPTVEHMWFKERQISLEGRDFKTCRFDECQIIIERGNFSIEGCVFDKCSFYLVGNAQITAKALVYALYHGKNIDMSTVMSIPPVARPDIASDGSVTMVGSR